MAQKTTTRFLVQFKNEKILYDCVHHRQKDNTI